MWLAAGDAWRARNRSGRNLLLRCPRELAPHCHEPRRALSLLESRRGVPTGPLRALSVPPLPVSVVYVRGMDEASHGRRGDVHMRVEDRVAPKFEGV